ncbi:hypothetical protein [Pseudonocardia sp. N23]|uniref:hypothetical protein n=1 Tax=Pseudonocardia sp. N23 TaxID=1987376 RepID=UPI000C034256|nr:hypothetical protein [Pseudonocardia sp. N23]GAY11551.1 hypothetical protein TOK_6061 [Pseudonocardia sp. N23]
MDVVTTVILPHPAAPAPSAPGTGRTTSQPGQGDRDLDSPGVRAELWFALRVPT